MSHPHALSMTPLARHALLKLRGRSGKGLAVFSGSVWVTEDGELDDKVLGPGESMLLNKRGLVIVQALEDVQLMVFDARGPAGGGIATALFGSAKAAGQTSSAAAPVAPDGPQLSVADYERIARVMRQQAVADGAQWVARAIGRLVARRPTAPAPAPAPAPAVPRPGRRALAGQAQH